MLTNTRARRAVTAVAFLMLLTVGCTGDPSPAPTTTAQPSTTEADTPTPTPTPAPVPVPDATTPPERPEAMSTPSAEGAAAAASYFVSLYPYARATGDTTEWQTLSGVECTFCASVLNEVSTLVEQGRSVIGGGISVESAIGSEVIANESYSADIVFNEAPTEIWKDATLVSTGDGGRITALVVLRWTGQAWQIRALDASPAA